MKLRFSVIIIIALAIATVVAQNSSPANRPITEKDLFDFVWIANPQLAPDGSRVAFTRVVVDEKRTGYETSIWTVATSGSEPPIRLTNGKHDGQPRWSADGKRLAFIRGGEKDDAGNPKPAQIAILPLAGGEARIVTDLPKGAATLVWSTDSKRIAFSSSTTPEDIKKGERAKNAAKPAETATKPGETPAKPDAIMDTSHPESDHESDVHVISRAVYRDNDEGYLDPKRHEHIWVLDLPNASDELTKPIQLTSGDYDEGEARWTNDGTRIYFLTTRIDEPYYENGITDIYSVSSTGGTPEKLATIPMDIGDLALSPDRRRLAFHGAVSQPVRSYSQPDVWVMDIAPNAQPRNLTANYDFDMGSSVFGDNAAPRGGNGRTLRWSPDGRSLFDLVEKRGRTPIVRVDAQSGAVTEITRGEQAVLDYSITPDARTTVALISTPVMIGDLFTIGGGAQTRPTDPHKTLWSPINLTTPQEINNKSFTSKK